MDRGDTFLLDPGDELHMSESNYLIFRSYKPTKEAELTTIQQREKAMFASDFLITGRLLGEGGYGKVLIGINQATQRQLACKVVRLDHLYTEPHIPNLRPPTDARVQKSKSGRKRWPTRVAACFREFDILKDLSHPNIVSIEKVFWSNNTIYILQELVTGGDLFSFLEYKGGRLDEALAAVVIRQVLLAIEYLHGQGIAHRDLKPDNILMTCLDDGARVVVTDFGSARYLPDTFRRGTQSPRKFQRMFSTAGTLEFTAPEIHGMNPMAPIEGGYTKSVDMWSIGTITAALLAGEYMFNDAAYTDYYGDPRRMIMALAARCDLSILDDEYHPSWSCVDFLPKDFIKRLLTLDEDARMTATEALEHDWFADEEFEKLYARCTRKWHPRSPSSQLVERISRALPDLTAVGLPGQALNQETVSRLFDPSEQQLTNSVIQSLSNSQHLHANSPLSSTKYDYANADLQFASPAAPSSYQPDSDLASHGQGSFTGSAEPQRQNYDQNFTPRFDEYNQESNIHERETRSSEHPRQEQFRNMPMSTNTIMPHEGYQGDSQESAESLNKTNDLAYSQYLPRPYIAHAAANHSSEVILVHDTPPTFEKNAVKQVKGSIHQARYLQELRNAQSSAEEQESVIVYETPPGGGTNHPASHENERMRYERPRKDDAVKYYHEEERNDDIEKIDPWSLLFHH